MIQFVLIHTVYRNSYVFYQKYNFGKNKIKDRKCESGYDIERDGTWLIDINGTSSLKFFRAFRQALYLQIYRHFNHGLFKHTLDLDNLIAHGFNDLDNYCCRAWNPDLHKYIWKNECFKTIRHLHVMFAYIRQVCKIKLQKLNIFIIWTLL